MERPSLAVLAGDTAARGWHVRDLERAASARGVRLRTLDFDRLAARLPHASVTGTRIGALDDDLTTCDAVVVRTMPKGSLEQIIFRMDLLHQLEARGVYVVNTPRALETAIDKYLSLARLDANGLPVPLTRVTQNADEAETLFEELGGDVIVKPLFGSEGRGLKRLTSHREAREQFRAIEETEGVFYLQKFIQHPGFDIRVLTCGNEIVGAIERHATEGWATNVALGGAARRLDPTPILQELALRAAATTGAEIAGVDILPDRDGKYWLLEVNGIPGWRAVSRACQVDVADRVLSYVLGKWHS